MNRISRHFWHLLLLAQFCLGAPLWAGSNTGIISTFAGVAINSGGLATQTELDLPDSSRSDDVGNIWVCDTTDQRVLRVDASTNVVTLVAGNGIAGYSGDNGLANSAEFDNPVASAFVTATLTSDNILYVSDQGNDIIRKIDVDTGIISTIAGTPQVSGYTGDNGLATSATLNNPNQLRVNGNFLLIADSGNNVIRQVDLTSLTITTVAGSLTGSAGYLDNAVATSGYLSDPQDVVFYNGVTYIADTGNNRIRAIENGGLTTIAGTGLSGYNGEGLLPWATKMEPKSLRIDSVGNVFYADLNNHRVREIYNVTVTPSCVSTVAGTGVNGYSGDGLSATAAEISNPYSLGEDYRNFLYIADRNNGRIRKVDLNTGLISTIAGDGNGDGNPANAAILKDPFGLCTDASGNVFIADRNNNRVRRVDAKTGIITTIAGNGEYGHIDGSITSNAEVANPMSVAVDPSGKVYFSEAYNGVSSYVRVISPDYLTLTTIAGGINGYSGTTYVAGALFNDPQGLFWDPVNPGLYISDTNNAIIERYDVTSLAISVVAGTIPTGTGSAAVAQTGYAGDGAPAHLALLFRPYGLYVDNNSDIYFADASNSCVRRVDGTSHNISTVAGQGGQFGYSGDGGLASACTLDFPMGVWLDSSNNLLISDTIDNRIREISAGTGLINTIAGNGLSGYSGDGGVPSSASLNHPEDLAEDSKGNVYFIDNNNNRIREISYAAQPTPLPLVGANSSIVFPSPASSQACFSFQSSSGGAINIKVYNLAYQLVATVTGQATASAGQSQNLCSDVSRLANGAYIYQLNVGGENFPIGKFKVIH